MIVAQVDTLAVFQLLFSQLCCGMQVVRDAAGQPCMLITTATVHAGASGGAVLDTGGRLRGLVTSNAR
jgi:hypothetical protein